MTREEAGIILEKLADWFDDPVGHTDLDSKRSEALRIGIKAIEVMNDDGEQ